jgi:hypothetical protein
MKCPKCDGLNIATDSRSAPVERPEGPWRHYHGLCCGCGRIFWWTAHPGDAHPILMEGYHDCAFFRPASEYA